MIYSDVVSTETLFFINQLPSSYKDKIPNELIEQLKENYSEVINDTLDNDKPFFRQKLDEKTQILISEITEKYLLH